MVYFFHRHISHLPDLAIALTAVRDVLLAGGEGGVSHSIPELILAWQILWWIFLFSETLVYLARLLVDGGAAAAHAGPGAEDLLLHHGQRAADTLPPELGGCPRVTGPLAVTLPQVIRGHDVRGHSWTWKRIPLIYRFSWGLNNIDFGLWLDFRLDRMVDRIKPRLMAHGLVHGS